MKSENLEATRKIRKALANGDESGTVERLPLSKSFYTDERIQTAITTFSDHCETKCTSDESCYYLTLQVREEAKSRKVIGEFLNVLITSAH